MKFTYAVPCDRPAQAVWETVADAQRLIRAIPGCEGAERVAAGPGGAGAEDGVEVYNVRVSTGLGPVRFRAAGTARVRKDPAARSLRADVSLSDPRAGSMHGTMAIEVRAVDEGHSELKLDAEVVLASKIGEFAQPMLRHKADQMVREFARNLTGAVR